MTFQYDPPEGLLSIEKYPSQPTSPTMARQQFMDLFGQIRDAHNSHLADNAQQFLDVVNVNARAYKTPNNTWEDAIEAAAIYANSLYLSEQPGGWGASWAGNVVVKVPRGKYVITRAMTIPVGVDLDLENCAFEANPSDKSFDCFNITNNCYRNNYIKGIFIGFRKAFVCSTQNADTSRLYFEGQTFHGCRYGIDTTSYIASRSTELVIEKFTSYVTDTLAKVHTDMSTMRNGWIYHTGFNGAAIYNQGFTKMENVVCVPNTHQAGARPRWIDNYSEDGGSTTILGERGIFVDHCRFGGEPGSCPIVFNYAAASLNPSNFKSTIIDIRNSYTANVGTDDKSAIVLFALPNRINIQNVSGLTDLTENFIQCDTTFDSTAVAYSPYISIEFDPSCYNPYGIMPADLYRFAKTFENSNTQWRKTFLDGKTQYSYPCVNASGNSKFSFKLNLPYDFSTVGAQKDFAAAFFLHLSADSDGGSYTYKQNALYYVSIVGRDTTGTYKSIKYTLVGSHKGGISDLKDCEIVSMHWGTGDAGSADQVYNSQNKDITVIFKGNYLSSSAVLIPIHGTGY